MKLYDKKILLNFLISRLIILLIVLIGCFIKNTTIIDILGYYDNEWYLDIAINGYNEVSVCFFPLIPLIIKLFNFIHIPILGTVIFNITLSYLSAILIYKITNNRFISYIWLYGPMGIFTSMLYTESMFIFLTLLCYYLYNNKKYFFAGIVLGLSVLTRSLGSMLFFSIFIFMFYNFTKKKEKFKNIFMMYVPATIISLLYPIYLEIKFGNWKIFVDSQFKYWNRIHGNLFSVMFKDIKFFFETDVPFFKINVIITILLFILMGYLIYKDIKNNKGLTINSLYLILSIFAIYSSCRASYNVPSTSFYRYFLGCSSFYLLFNNKLLNKNFLSIIFINLLGLTFMTTALFSVNAFFC